MAISSAAAAATVGLLDAQSRFDSAADRLNASLSGGSEEDVVRAVVDLIANETAFRANAGVLDKTTDIEDALLDVLA